MGYSDRDNRRVKIHIDLAAMRHNLNRACLAAPGKKTFCVVKSDAYGHGLQKVVPALRQSDGYAVANVEEGLAVRNQDCLLYTSPSPRDRQKSRMPSSA